MQIKTDLRSYFFDLFGLVNSTEHFKKHPSGLISFTQLCSAHTKSVKEGKDQPVKHKWKEGNISRCMFNIPVCLLSLVKTSDIMLIVLLIISLNFPRICLLKPSRKTGRIVLQFPKSCEFKKET